MISRSERFDEIVMESFERVEARVPGRLESVDLAVDLVPPVGPAALSRRTERQVALGETFTAKDGRTRLVVYRRPIEARARDLGDLVALIDRIVVEQVASILAMNPIDLDPDYGLD